MILFFSLAELLGKLGKFASSTGISINEWKHPNRLTAWKICIYIEIDCICLCWPWSEQRKLFDIVVTHKSMHGINLTILLRIYYLQCNLCYVCLWMVKWLFLVDSNNTNCKMPDILLWFGKRNQMWMLKFWGTRGGVSIYNGHYQVCVNCEL